MKLATHGSSFIITLLLVAIRCQPLQFTTSSGTLSGSGFPSTSNPIVSDTVVYPPSPTSPTAGKIRYLIFQQPGDMYTVPSDVPIHLIFDHVDLDRSVLVVSENSEEGTYTFSLQSRTDLTITLSKKCQVTEVFNVTELPRIKVTPAMSREQVVITPILDVKTCSVKGFQIRLGTTERGCRSSKTQAYLDRLQRCRGNNRYQISNRSQPEHDSPCIERRLFGLDCPD